MLVVLSLLQAQRRWIERLAGLMNRAAGWLYVVCAFFVTFDVIGRKFFGISSKATVELTGYMLAFGIAWGLTDALATRAHIRVDVLVTRLPVRLRVYMHALALGFLAVLSFFLVWRCWAVVHDSWLFGARDSSALTTPLIIPQGLWALGITVFFLLALVMLLEVVVSLVLGQAERVDRLLGPRTVDEETAEALGAAAMAGRG
jgi:TRAP-type mannitol/chloroaromatic compound transport system permease small subunit